MRLFGSERLMKIFTSLGVAENEQIEHKMLSNAIQKAQEKICLLYTSAIREQRPVESIPFILIP